jgi:hypothetical protein
VENKQYPYQVEERRHVNGDRYWSVYFHGRLLVILRSKKVADEYIEFNKKYKEK